MHPISWTHKKYGITQERQSFSMARTNKKYTSEFKIEVIKKRLKKGYYVMRRQNVMIFR